MQKKRRIITKGKQLGLICGALLFLVGPVFAVDGISKPETTDIIEAVARALFYIGDIASWIWIILGNIAGKLMTNTLVYGEFMGLDSFLWKTWQITRTFANYAIGFLFGYSIFKYILFPSGKDQTPIKTIKQLLVASVLVQASRFLVMVLVDISTIALATVSSFPSQVLTNSNYSQTAMIASIKANRVLGSAIKDQPEAVILQPYVDAFDKTKKQLNIEMISLEQSVSEKNLIDNLLPKPDNLAGPLTYLGFTVFKTHDFLREYTVHDANTVEKLTKIIISLMFDAGMIILFSFALAVLVIVLIVRLAYLWIFIVASPIIFLLAVTKVIDLGKISEFLDLKKILNLIFKPVMFALWMSVMFLVVVVMQGFFRGGAGDFNGALKVSETSLTSVDGNTTRYRSELEIPDVVNVVIEQGTKSFRDIIISLIVLAMMRYFVKLAISTKTGTALDKFTQGVANTAEKVIGNIGLIPTPTGTIGLNQIWKNGSSPVLDMATNTYISGLQQRDSKGQQELASFFGTTASIPPLTVNEHIELQRAAQSKEIKAFPEYIAKIKDQNKGIKFLEIKQYIPEWIALNQDRKLNELRSYLGTNFTKNPKFNEEGKTTEETKANKLQALDALFANQVVFQEFYKTVLGGTDSNMTYSRLNTNTGEIRAED